MDRELRRLLSIINRILRFVGQDMDLRFLGRKTKYNPWIMVSVVVGVGYTAYLIPCLMQMTNLEAKSDIVWIAPFYIQHCILSVNGGWINYQTGLEFLNWITRVFEEPNSMPFIQRHVLLANGRCLKIAKYVCYTNIILFHFTVLFYIGEWARSDKVLLTNIAEPDVELSTECFVANFLFQLLNAGFICYIMLGYNMFFYLGTLVLIHRRKTIVAVLKELRNTTVAIGGTEVTLNKWRREVLIECHKMNTDVAYWTNRFKDYHDIVGLFVMPAYLLTECFLLYLLSQQETVNVNAICSFLTAIFVVFVTCVFGELITEEAENIRDKIYELNWEDYNRESRRMVYLMLVGNTPETTIQVCRIFPLGMLSFTKFSKMCFSVYALLNAL